MKWHTSEMHRMHRMHLPHVHAIHLHPIHWLSKHPLVLAVLIAGLVTLLFIGLTSMTDTIIRIDTLDRINYPVMTPYGGAY